MLKSALNGIRQLVSAVPVKRQTFFLFLIIFLRSEFMLFLVYCIRDILQYEVGNNAFQLLKNLVFNMWKTVANHIPNVESRYFISDTHRTLRVDVCAENIDLELQVETALNSTLLIIMSHLSYNHLSQPKLMQTTQLSVMQKSIDISKYYTFNIDITLKKLLIQIYENDKNCLLAHLFQHQ